MASTDLPPSPGISEPDRRRRALLRGGAALPLIGLASIAPRAWGSTDPFTLGVASGEPRPDGFVAWTRLAPDPLNLDPRTPGGLSGGDRSLVLQIAADDTMRRLIRRQDVTAPAREAWSVHAIVAGLEPDRRYWYRFVSDDAASAVGCVKTAPAPGATIEALRLGFVSCANYEAGWFSAYRHLADEQVDAVLFLGDYLYEGYDKQRRGVRSHSGGAATHSLRDYRNRHAQYRSDPDLQRVHAAAASLITWDDHEVQNDYADRWSMTFDDPARFLRRRAAAYPAFYEHMPLSPHRRRDGAALQIYDRYRFGQLLEVSMIDGRQYRSREACYRRPDKGGAHLETDAACPERRSPERSMLGAEQERWLHDGLSRSDARWNLIGQDVLMAQFKERNDAGETGFWTDDWNGYPATRDRLLEHIEQSRIANVVTVGGDLHSFWANDLKHDFDDPASRTVASEFITTSITSAGPPHDTFMSWMPDNPHVKFFDARVHGYSVASITTDRFDMAFRTVSDVRDPAAAIATFKRFTVENGRPGPVPA
ncbi:alkaline phosphatase D family protein [soil metagenome]